MKSVYSAVRAGPLNKAVCGSSVKGKNISLENKIISENATDPYGVITMLHIQSVLTSR
jgi:hypothetical protein